MYVLTVFLMDFGLGFLLQLCHSHRLIFLGYSNCTIMFPGNLARLTGNKFAWMITWTFIKINGQKPQPKQATVQPGCEVWCRRYFRAGGFKEVPHRAEALVPSPQRTEPQKQKLAFTRNEDACFDQSVLAGFCWLLVTGPQLPHVTPLFSD